VFGGDWVHPEDKDLPVEDQRWYNSAFAMDANGKLLGRYAKRRLVPFGEYIPFTKTLPFMLWLRSVTRDSYRPGEEPSPVVEAGGMRFAFNLCIEDVHPDLAREAAASGADVLMNLTNDGWFHGTFGPAAHLQAARLRAVEVRRPMVRVTNSGVSALVDPLGRLNVPIAPDRIGVGIAQVQLLQEPPGKTLYMRLGEGGVALACAVILLLGLSLDVISRPQDDVAKDVAP
ncbi:MAG: apolipoprotein N-acyltransferase, partial [Planctomycetota bacterium]|nr:apolipoprotein N-acyltransferase [Planctomycetota bacterium]